MVWVFENVSPSILNKIWLCGIMFSSVGILFGLIYESCKTTNQEKTATNANQTVKKTTPSQFNTEPVTYSTHITPTKQYPVLGEIQKIISNLTELEKNQDLDKDLFVQFHTLKKQFNSDYQEIVKMLNTLGEIDQFDDNHLKPFNHYLDAFKKQQQMIYDNIKQQYNDKLNTISEQLQHFN